MHGYIIRILLVTQGGPEKKTAGLGALRPAAAENQRLGANRAAPARYSAGLWKSKIGREGLPGMS